MVGWLKSLREKIMGASKVIFAAISGILIGSYMAGINLVSQVGLAFDKQMAIGIVAFFAAMVIHVLLGG